jgi:hypothetical protein
MTDKQLLLLMAAIVHAGRCANGKDISWKITPLQQAQKIVDELAKSEVQNDSN